MVRKRVKTKDVLFFWLPKNAGTSVYTTLKKYGCVKRQRPKLFTKFNNTGFVTFGHVDINYLLQHHFVSQRYFKDAFKFCVVRNPWDRLVSLYFYLGKDKMMPFDRFVQLIKKQHRPQNPPFPQVGLFDFLVHNNQFFRAMMKLIFGITRKYLPWLEFRLPGIKIGPYNNLGLSQTNPQVDWITDRKGNLIVDLICKYENLNNDFLKVCDIIGIPHEKLPRLNKTNHRDYKKYYDEKTKKIVKNIYKKDIEKFGYKF